MLLHGPAQDTASSSFPDSLSIGLMDKIGLNGQVVIDKFSGERVVGPNAPDFRRDDDNILRPCLLEPLLNKLAVPQIELFAGPREAIYMPPRFEEPENSRSHHASMTSHIDARVFLHHPSLSPYYSCRLINYAAPLQFAHHLAHALIELQATGLHAEIVLFRNLVGQ